MTCTRKHQRKAEREVRKETFNIEIERPNVEDTNNKILKYKIYVHIFIEIEITTENKENNIKFM